MYGIRKVSGDVLRGTTEEGLINFAMEMRLGGRRCSRTRVNAPDTGDACTSELAERRAAAARTWEERDRASTVRLSDNFLPAVSLKRNAHASRQRRVTKMHPRGRAHIFHNELKKKDSSTVSRNATS